MRKMYASAAYLRVTLMSWPFKNVDDTTDFKASASHLSFHRITEAKRSLHMKYSLVISPKAVISLLLDTKNGRNREVQPVQLSPPCAQQHVFDDCFSLLVL